MIAEKEKKPQDPIENPKPFRQDKDINNLLLEKKEFTSDIQYHLESIKANLSMLQLYHSTNNELFTAFKLLISKTELILNLVSIETRFDYVSVQNVIDELYKKDKSLTGCQTNFDWVLNEIPNRAILQVNLFNKLKKV